MMSHPNIGVTLGDPAGIGPEVAAKALLSGRFPLEHITLIGNKESFMETVTSLHLDARRISSIPFVNIDAEEIRSGRPGRESGAVALRTIETAVSLALEGRFDGICTGPISKEAVKLAGSRFIDHTTLLGHLTASEEVVTVFEVKRLRILFMTKHLPLRSALELITQDNVANSIRLADMSLRHLGQERRRIAVASLNPHGGENGLLGDEEIREIAPAVKRMQKEYDVQGPFPADSVFYHASRGRFDIVVSLYHDQGHIAAKTYDFARTVSMNIGLPFLRTSVDHGTAFDIAGKGIADETSMREAIKCCQRYASRYKRFRLSMKR